MEATWRERAQDVIQRVRIANPSARGDDLKKLLRAAYPFGERQYWPYKVWCTEVAYTLGTKQRPKRGAAPPSTLPEHPGQTRLFAG